MKLLYTFIVVLIWLPLASNADDSLLVYLPFDEAGDTEDASDNGNDGEVIGGKADWVDGRFGGGIQLDGTNAIGIPWSDSIDVADGSFTAEIWFKYSEAADSGSLVWAFDMGSGAHGQFWVRTEPGDNRIRGLMNDGAGPSVIVVTSTPYNDDEWHHLAFVRDADDESLTMYIDGDVEQSSNGKVGSLTGTQAMGIDLGQRGLDGVNKFKGVLDEFRFWGKALDANEVKTNMASNKSKILAVQPMDHLAATWGGVKAKY